MNNNRIWCGTAFLKYGIKWYSSSWFFVMTRHHSENISHSSILVIRYFCHRWTATRPERPLKTGASVRFVTAWKVSFNLSRKLKRTPNITVVYPLISRIGSLRLPKLMGCYWEVFEDFPLPDWSIFQIVTRTNEACNKEFWNAAFC